MLKVTTEKDGFTGLKKITTPLIDLTNFKSYNSILSMTIDQLSDGFGESKGRNAFELFYAESEEGQGTMAIRIYSLLSRSNNWPNWNDSWPLIIDGDRASLESTSKNQYEKSNEFKVYNLPVDLFNKICNAKEVKFSLRGQNLKVEGIFTSHHQTIFKAFEQFCFGDEAEGNKIVEILNKSLPNDDEVTEAADDGANNTIKRPIKLSPEEIEKHEAKTVELIKEKKVSDAIKYYAANFGESNKNSGIKVKEFAEKNGLTSIYKRYDNKQNLYAYLFLIVVALVLMLFRKC